MALQPVHLTESGVYECFQEWNRRPRGRLFQPFDKLPSSPRACQAPDTRALGQRLLFLPSPILHISTLYRCHLRLNLFTLNMFFDRKSFKFEIVDSFLCFLWVKILTLHLTIFKCRTRWGSNFTVFRLLRQGKVWLQSTKSPG